MWRRIFRLLVKKRWRDHGSGVVRGVLGIESSHHSKNFLFDKGSKKPNAAKCAKCTRHAGICGGHQSTCSHIVTCIDAPRHIEASLVSTGDSVQVRARASAEPWLCRICHGGNLSIVPCGAGRLMWRRDLSSQHKPRCALACHRQIHLWHRQTWFSKKVWGPSSGKLFVCPK